MKYAIKSYKRSENAFFLRKRKYFLLTTTDFFLIKLNKVQDLRFTVSKFPKNHR